MRFIVNPSPIPKPFGRACARVRFLTGLPTLGDLHNDPANIERGTYKPKRPEKYLRVLEPGLARKELLDISYAFPEYLFPKSVDIKSRLEDPACLHGSA